jgi:hypothetical protein
MAESTREKSSRKLEALMLGRNLFEAWERFKVKRKEVEGKSDWIEGLPYLIF